MTIEQWPMRPLGDVASMRSGGTPSRSVSRFFGGGIPWVSIADMTLKGKYISSTATTLTHEGLSSSAATLYEPGVVLYAMYASLGEVSLAVGRVSSSQAILGIKPGPELDREFLFYYLTAIKNSVKDLGQQGTQSNLNARIVRDLPIPVPAIAEQRAIGRALDDADNLIVMLERLIAKKQAIKQGMMQQLLAGRTRLPGLTGEWTSCRLRDVLTVRHGRSQRGVERPSGGVPILATGGQIGWADRPLYSKPSVLIGRKGTIDRPQYQSKPFWTVDTLFYTEIAPNSDPKFLFYVFQTVDWRSMNEASGVPSLSSTRIESVEVQLPGLPEQIAIRAVLDDAEAEIASLNLRLTKARAIKQGMMQQLLTGHVHLPVEAAE